MNQETDKAMEQLVRRIVEAVVRRQQAEEEEEEAPSGGLALVTSHVAWPQRAWRTLEKEYGAGLRTVSFGEETPALGSGSERYEDIGAAGVMERASGSGRLVLVTPKLTLLGRIARGDDAGLVEHVVTRMILWGREVSILLDFEAPRQRRNAFYEKVCEDLCILQEMGVRMLGYGAGREAAGTGLSLVTEREVTEAYEAGREIVCAAHAIITPSARDKARELGVRMN